MTDSTTPRMLTEPAVVFQQVKSFLSNDSEILSTDGDVIGYVHTSGGKLAKMVLGNVYMDLLDENQQPLLKIDDTFNILRDSFSLKFPDGSECATLTNNMKLFGRRMTMNLADGTEFLLENQGSFSDFTFDVWCGDFHIAQIAREWAGAGKALLGHSRYGISFAPEVTPEHRLAVIGMTVALDLRRAKENNQGSGLFG